MTPVQRSLTALAETLEQRWKAYLAQGQFDQFVEFALSLNGLTERLSKQNLPGAASACQDLENRALALLDSNESLDQAQSESISRQIEAITGVLRRHEAPPASQRQTDQGCAETLNGCFRQRNILIVSEHGLRDSAPLVEQLAFYGFKARAIRWDSPPPPDESPLAAIFLPSHPSAPYPAAALAAITRLRSTHVTAYFYCLGTPPALETIVSLQRAGVNVCMPSDARADEILSRLLDLIESREQEHHRVLIVEDSRTAIAHVQRSLDIHGIESRAIDTPLHLLETVADYRPHAILMDMHMPFCNGVEATRALRQIPEFQSTPVIYLSGETEIAQQVEALRLGGDQFLIKPANPILLAAVVKNKIERYREMLHAGHHDSLTGLLNHAAAKARLARMLSKTKTRENVTVAMIDIDRFKSINDNYGHPVGDQVIRSLAWLLRGRLRNTDLIGRYGGEEFLVALSGASAEQAAQLLDRIRHDFSQLPHCHTQGTLTASFSCGLAVTPIHNTASALIEAADAALLQAKRDGRNRIVIAG